jgi:hypothetical protein
MSRLETKFRLMRELGSLLDPLERLLFNDAEPNPSMAKVALLTGQYKIDFDTFYPNLGIFCIVHGVTLQIYMTKLYSSLYGLQIILQSYNIRNISHIREEFRRLKNEIEAALVEVPADDPDVMLPPQSPFQTYLRLLATCGATSTRLQLFDPYLDAEVFDRYLPDVRNGVEITLVTEVGNLRNARRRGRIIAISELVALERPTCYSFLEAPSLHDRHLRADDKIYHLGGSVKDASKKDYYTITETDSNQALHSVLDGIVTASTPWYQPGMPRHRRWCSTCNLSSDVQPSGVCIACGNQT